MYVGLSGDGMFYSARQVCSYGDGFNLGIVICGSVSIIVWHSFTFFAEFLTLSGWVMEGSLEHV